MPELNALADACYSQFVHTLQLLEECGNRRVLKSWEQDLRELMAQAEELINTPSIGEKHKSKLRVMLTSTAEEWIIKTRGKNSVYLSY